MTVKFSNNATSRLAASVSSSDVTISVQPGEGARFPVTTGGNTFPVTLVKSTGQLEICRCTGRSGDILTVVRGQENTSAISFSAGDIVQVRMTEGTFEERLGEKLDKAGGDVSGPVTMKGAAEKLVIERPATGEAKIITAKTTTGLPRWDIVLPDHATDDLSVVRYNDDGDSQGAALTIDRSSGAVNVDGAAGFGGPVKLDGSDNILPVYSSPPASDKGDIHVVGVGPMKWNGTAYVSVSGTGKTFAEISALSSDQGPIICTDHGGATYVWSGTAYAPLIADETYAGAVKRTTTELAKALEDDETVVTPEKLGDALNAHVFGMGQAWQNVTASRAGGTTYTNTTGRTIQVSMSGTTGASLTLTVNGTTLAPVAYSLHCAIPAGATYSVSLSGGSISGWNELR